MKIFYRVGTLKSVPMLLLFAIAASFSGLSHAAQEATAQTPTALENTDQVSQEAVFQKIESQENADQQAVGKKTIAIAPAKSIVWIDTRSWIENKISNIEGDPRISYTDIVAGVQELGLDKDAPIKLYCAVGVRAGKAVKQLQAAGYSDVENAGGIGDVRSVRFPTAQ